MTEREKKGLEREHIEQQQLQEGRGRGGHER